MKMNTSIKYKLYSCFTMVNAMGHTLSTKDLGYPEAFTVGDKTYLAYNSFMLNQTRGASWQDAQDFVAMHNEAEYSGYSDWMLINDIVCISSEHFESAIGTAWRSNYKSSMVLVGDEELWTSTVYDVDWTDDGSKLVFFLHVDAGDILPAPAESVDGAGEQNIFLGMREGEASNHVHSFTTEWTIENGYHWRG